MEMLLNGTPKWTHITRDGRKAIVITDQIDASPCVVLAVIESDELLGKYKTVHLDRNLKFYGDVEESVFDLRPYNPFEGLPVDTPIWVKRDGGHWYRRHFARYEGALVYVWRDGRTSFTQDGEVEYLTYSLTDPEEDDL